MSNGVKLKLLIFDFWGTLAYMPNMDLKEFYSSLGNFGIEVKTEEKIKRFSFLFSQAMCFSESWEDFSSRLLENFTENLTEKRVKNFADFLKEKIIFDLYDDVEDILQLPFRKAILTDSARLLVESSGLQEYAKIFTPKETGSRKPDQKVFLTVLEKLKIKAENALMVGDDIKRDLVPAQKIGMKTVLIDRKDEFPDYSGLKVNSLKKLKGILEND